jgi:quinol monooxygenase YgiN
VVGRAGHEAGPQRAQVAPPEWVGGRPGQLTAIPPAGGGSVLHGGRSAEIPRDTSSSSGVRVNLPAFHVQGCGQRRLGAGSVAAATARVGRRPTKGWHMTMYARSTTILADPVRIDDGIGYVRDTVMPAVQAMPGCVGLSMMVDRETGRCIITTSWQDAASLAASAGGVSPLRDRAATIFGGAPGVQEWEIAALHRMRSAGEAACVRAVWMRVDPMQADLGIEVYRESVLPALEDLEGCCSASLFVDREAGRAVSSVTYDGRAALESSREAALALRRSAVLENDVEITSVGEFELVLAHLRVPQTV